MDMLNLVESVPRMVATEAINYCMRALSQVGTPIEVQRDYFHDTASSRPTPEAVDLAKTILSKIEEEEGIDLDHLDVRKAEMYICELGMASDELILRMEGFNRERGAELVRRLFYSEP